MEHKQNLSDHKLIKIKLNIKGKCKKKEPDKKIRSKHYAEWASIKLLEDLLASEGIEEIMKAFEER